MAQIILNKKVNIEQNGSSVSVFFDCLNEEQADRLCRSLGIGMSRGIIKFAVKIPKETVVKLVE